MRHLKAKAKRIVDENMAALLVALSRFLDIYDRKVQLQRDQFTHEVEQSRRHEESAARFQLSLRRSPPKKKGQKRRR